MSDKQKTLRFLGVVVLGTACWIGLTALLSPNSMHSLFSIIGPITLTIGGVVTLSVPPVLLSRLAVAAVAAIYLALGLRSPLQPSRLDYWFGGPAAGLNLATGVVLMLLLAFSLARSGRETRSEARK